MVGAFLLLVKDLGAGGALNAGGYFMYFVRAGGAERFGGESLA